MAQEIKGQTSTSSVGNPWSLPWEDVVWALGGSAEEGLGTGEIRKRHKRYDPNRLKKAKRKPAWVILIDQFKNLIILMLVAATILAFLFGQWLEGVSIIVAILINTVIGFFTELNAVRSIEIEEGWRLGMFRKVGQTHYQITLGFSLTV